LKRAVSADPRAAASLTFPSRVPVFGLDRVYLRGFRCLSSSVPRGLAWARMSDHLPLVVELQPLASAELPDPFDPMKAHAHA
jgi:endonuclease/exonuclease/phosphatase family metal-dependent hydrolase